MTSNQTGRLIGAIFGLVFVLANAGALPTAAAVPVCVLGIASFIWLFVALRRVRTPPAGGGGGAAPRRFGRSFFLVVAAEIAVALAGFLVVNLVFHAPQAAVPWLSLVVGLHFFGLAAIWHMPSLRLLAASMAACGAAGLVLAACGASPAVIATASGIAPGALLLGSVWWSLRTP
ncbi:hypothetical protein ABZY81_10715 [Streptomyces sp. NPDC006514]|uniref:hypothetical protein n=1 Tax=Streptomyces sp. NPDC006514 TaxID=3154308 RepID=UPI00339FE2BA